MAFQCASFLAVSIPPNGPPPALTPKPRPLYPHPPQQSYLDASTPTLRPRRTYTHISAFIIKLPCFRLPMASHQLHTQTWPSVPSSVSSPHTVPQVHAVASQKRGEQEKGYHPDYVTQQISSFYGINTADPLSRVNISPVYTAAGPSPSNTPSAYNDSPSMTFNTSSLASTSKLATVPPVLAKTPDWETSLDPEPWETFQRTGVIPPYKSEYVVGRYVSLYNASAPVEPMVPYVPEHSASGYKADCARILARRRKRETSSVSESLRVSVLGENYKRGGCCPVTTATLQEKEEVRRSHEHVERHKALDEWLALYGPVSKRKRKRNEKAEAKEKERETKRQREDQEEDEDNSKMRDPEIRGEATVQTSGFQIPGLGLLNRRRD